MIKVSARIVFALVFLFSGATVHLLQARQGIAYARMYRVPAAALLVPLSGVIAVAGALSVILGGLGGPRRVAARRLPPTGRVLHAWLLAGDGRAAEEQSDGALHEEHGDGRGALVLFYAYNQLQGEAGLSITDPLFGRG